jgi:hypothetical protein
MSIRKHEIMREMHGDDSGVKVNDEATGQVDLAGEDPTLAVKKCVMDGERKIIII